MKIFRSNSFIPCTVMSANGLSNAHGHSIHRVKVPFVCLSLTCLCLTAWSGNGLALATAVNATKASEPATEILQSAPTTDSGNATQKSNLRASYHTCLDASDGVTAKVLDCVSTEFTYQDARLNRIYQQLRSTLPPAQKIRLRDEERQWISEGSAACNSTVDGGGTADLLNTQSCSLKRTADRADALEKMAENKHDH
jgi:uncharacterized protein YecT (DUF1311 family)